MDGHSAEEQVINRVMDSPTGKKVSTGHFLTPVSTLMQPFRIPLPQKNKIRNPQNWIPDFGRSIGIRTRGLLDPNPKGEIAYSIFQ